MNDDETFFAWLDGELGPTEAAAMEAKVAADPELACLAERHRALGARLRGAFDPIATAAVPDRLASRLRPAAPVIDLATERRKRWRLPPMQQWAAIAATLVVGVLAGTMIPHGGSAPVEVQGGKIYAAATLDQALQTQLASAPAGDVRIGVTFRDRSGEICRSFVQSASSGLACRSGGRWQLKGLFAAPEGQGSDYRMAGGIDPNLAALVDSAMAGEPLNALQERAAKQRGWK